MLQCMYICSLQLLDENERLEFSYLIPKFIRSVEEASKRFWCNDVAKDFMRHILEISASLCHRKYERECCKLTNHTGHFKKNDWRLFVICALIDIFTYHDIFPGNYATVRLRNEHTVLSLFVSLSVCLSVTTLSRTLFA